MTIGLQNQLFNGQPSTAPFDSAAVSRMDWDTMNSLAYKYQGEVEDSARGYGEAIAAIPDERLRLAAWDGVSFEMKKAIMELDREGRPPPPQPETSYGHGRDDKDVSEWKARNKDRQREEGIQKLMKLRGVPREEAERMIPRT